MYLRSVCRAASRVQVPRWRQRQRLFSAGAGSASKSNGNNSAPPVIVADSEAEADTVKTALAGLLADTAPDSGGHNRRQWTLTATGHGIERSFRFKTFTKTWDFMTAVALQCKLRNHHPEWSNVFNTTLVRWTTHSPRPGLTHKDVAMAAVCDGLARDFGEILSDGEQKGNKPAPPPPASPGKDAGLQSMADHAATLGCDCDTQKPNKL